MFSKYKTINVFFVSGEPIPRIKYTQEETDTWNTVFKTLRPLYDRYASSEFKKGLKELEQYCDYR